MYQDVNNNQGLENQPHQGHNPSFPTPPGYKNDQVGSLPNQTMAGVNGIPDHTEASCRKVLIGDIILTFLTICNMTLLSTLFLKSLLIALFLNIMGVLMLLFAFSFLKKLGSNTHSNINKVNHLQNLLCFRTLYTIYKIFIIMAVVFACTVYFNPFDSSSIGPRIFMGLIGSCIFSPFTIIQVIWIQCTFKKLNIRI